MADQPLIDISPENWKIVCYILRRHVPEREIWAFGSRAKWTAKEFSDLDIAIIGDETLSVSLMADLREAFQESALPFKVDVVDLASTSGTFRKVIERDKVWLRGANQEGGLRADGRALGTKWPLVPFGELTNNFDSLRKSVKKSERKNGPYPYYGASGIVDYVDGYIFEGEHLLIAGYGENLRSRQAPIGLIASGKYWVNNHAHIVSGNDRASTPYLLYALRNADIGPYLTGTVMPNLTQGNMNKIMLPCPSLAVQEVVVGILGTLDDRILLLQETNSTLEAIAQALFKSWFVDFDPVRAKAEGGEPEGVPPEIAGLFPSEFEDSALGEIPKGWKAGSFGDYAVLAKRDVNPQQSPHAEYIHYSLPAFNEGQMPVNEKGAGIMSNKTIVPDCAVLQFKLSPHNPRIWLVGTGQNNAVCSTGFLPWISTKSSSMELIYCIFRSPIFERNMMTLVTSTSNSHKRVKPDQISRIPLVFSNSKINHAFADIVRPIFSRVVENRQSASILVKMKSELLPKLMQGRLALSESV